MFETPLAVGILTLIRILITVACFMGVSHSVRYDIRPLWFVCVVFVMVNVWTLSVYTPYFVIPQVLAGVGLLIYITQTKPKGK